MSDTATASQPQLLDLPPGVPPLRSLYMYISGSCNLACRHCWITPSFVPSGEGGQYLKLEYAEKAIREAKPLGLRSVKLTGGEPMLHPQFKELVGLLHASQVSVTMETNGTLIDDEMAHFLKEKGVTSVSVSVDGAKAETHDLLRMVPGSFERALNGVRALVKVKFPVQIICTLHRGNVAEMEEIVSLGEQLGCGSVKFNHVQPVGRGERFGQDRGLEVVEIIDLNQHIRDVLSVRHSLPIILDIPLAFQSTRQLFKKQSQCGIMTMLGILSNGAISMCGIGVTTPELVYGTIADGDLRSLWCTNETLLRLRCDIPSRLEGVCRSCIHRNRCLGHCIAHNYYASGSLFAPNRFCQEADRLALFPHARRRNI